MDFAIKEVSLDFSKMRTAAFGLWSKSSKLFSLSSNNAILEFLLEVSAVQIDYIPCILTCMYMVLITETNYYHIFNVSYVIMVYQVYQQQR